MAKRTLVAFFSAGGVTGQVAEKLAEVTNGELFEIRPAVPYTKEDLDWTDNTSRSTIEMRDAASRPAIGARLSGMEEFDTVFVGFPIWWYTAPTIILTFLESYDFSGKTIIPFATSGSSKFGKSADQMKQCCSEGTLWKEGRRLERNVTKEALEKWVESLGL